MGDTEVEETVEGVLVNATEVGLGDVMALSSLRMVELATKRGADHRGREWTVGGRDKGDDRDTIAVGVSDERDKETIDGDALEGLSSIVLSRLGSP